MGNLTRLFVVRFTTALLFSSAVFVPFLASIGAPDEGVFVIEAVFMAVWAIAAIPCGRLSDRWSRSGMMQIGTAIGCVAFCLYACATEFWHSLVAEALLAVGFAFQVSSIEPLVVETLLSTGDEDRCRAELGRQSAAWMWGSALASVLGALIALLGLRWTMILSIPPQIVAFIATLGLQDPARRKSHPSFWATLHGLTLQCPLRLSVVAFNGVVFPILLCLSWFMQVHLKQGEFHVFVFGIANMSALLLSGLVSHFTHTLEKRGVSDRLLLCTVAVVMSTALLAPSYLGASAAVVAICLGRVASGMNQPVMSDILARLARREDHSTVVAIQVVLQRSVFALICPFIVIGMRTMPLVDVMWWTGIGALCCFVLAYATMQVYWHRMPERIIAEPTDLPPDPVEEHAVM